MQAQSSSRCRLVLLFAALSIVTQIGRSAADEPPPNDATEKRTKAARRDAMRRFVESFKEVRKGKERDDRCTRVEEPVMYFSDPVYHPEIGEGTMWVWKCEGRPQVIAEVYNWGPKDNWTMGLYSFATTRLSFTDADGRRWEYRETDFKPRKIPDAPAPARTEAGRMRQMKQLAQRFTAAERQASWNDPDRPRYELRLLTQPIYRYIDQSLRILDGAVFVFVHGGTNAQIAMLLEVQSGEGDELYWTAGFGRLNVGENQVLLDNRSFWTEAEMERPVPTEHPSNYIRKVVPWRSTPRTGSNHHLKPSGRRPPMALLKMVMTMS